MGHAQAPGQHRDEADCSRFIRRVWGRSSTDGGARPQTLLQILPTPHWYSRFSTTYWRVGVNNPSSVSAVGRRETKKRNVRKLIKNDYEITSVFFRSEASFTKNKSPVAIIFRSAIFFFTLIIITSEREARSEFLLIYTKNLSMSGRPWSRFWDAYISGTVSPIDKRSSLVGSPIPSAVYGTNAESCQCQLWHVARATLGDVTNVPPAVSR